MPPPLWEQRGVIREIDTADDIDPRWKEEAAVLWEERDVRERALEAFRLWERSFEESPWDGETLSALCRSPCFLVQRHLRHKDVTERRALLEKGLHYCERAMLLHSPDFRLLVENAFSLDLAQRELGVSGAPLLYWYAWSMVEWLQGQPLKGARSRQLLYAMARHLIKIAPSLDDGGPHRLLARLHNTYPGLNRDEEAVRHHLAMALKHFPRRVDNTLSLIIDSLIPERRWSEARSRLRKLLRQPRPPKAAPEDLLALRQGKELLPQLSPPSSSGVIMRADTLPGLSAPTTTTSRLDL